MSRSADAAAANSAGRRRRTWWRTAGVGLVALLALVGAGMIGAALNAPDLATPREQVAGSATTAPTGSDLPTPPPSGSGPATGAEAYGRSAPVRVTIPAIGVAAAVIPVGVDPDGMVEVPPLDKAQLAGWYEPGPSPGETGNSVIVGHVDSKELGPAVFYRLGSLRAGDRIEVTRQDGRTAVFLVDSVRSYPKEDFPTDLVYGPSPVPGLRLVTCGGDFDEQTGSYPDNIVAFATLTG
ncbi:class F sortase [Micromonospora sp. HM5-17]|jgi:hypothetical protein|uniref:class F sortase n=1 Tax=Micromonospora sp. HM5-17 TaxID=2487710 RepID=UPI000F48E969|nr:class F sortase [Micromonospora sp. HM5-17]ROT32364.1 class F sortase [Micromonospora sp. HM5-17]